MSLTQINEFGPPQCYADRTFFLLDQTNISVFHFFLNFDFVSSYISMMMSKFRICMKTKKTEANHLFAYPIDWWRTENPCKCEITYQEECLLFALSQLTFDLFTPCPRGWFGSQHLNCTLSRCCIEWADDFGADQCINWSQQTHMDNQHTDDRTRMLYREQIRTMLSDSSRRSDDHWLTTDDRWSTMHA